MALYIYIYIYIYSMVIIINAHLFHMMHDHCGKFRMDIINVLGLVEV